MAIFPVARLMALIACTVALASCAGSGVIGEYVPHWAGGLPNNAPPRPGTPEYDAYKQHQAAEAARDKSKDPAKPKTNAESVTPSQTTQASPPTR
jgi:hypothetical protein